ncbi:MAG: nuclear transport factor 2 family protein [Woeseiaceae bacterium]
MATTRIVPVILMLSAICAHADTSTQTAAGPSREAQIIALDDAWVDAEVHGDRAALERILHEDFLVTYASGRTVDRTTFIDGILKARLAPFTVIHKTIRVHGDTALIIDVSEDGKTKFTWIAIKRDGQWRVISETGSRVESP